MKNNKNRAKQVTTHSDLIFEEEIQDLADAIAEGVQKTPTLSDPFEDYIDEVQAKFHSNPHIFRSRLVKGYNALLHELLALQEGESSSEKPS